MYKFCELTDTEFQEYVDSNENKHFMQTIYMNKYYQLKGKETHLVGVKKDNKVVCAALVYLESTYRKYKKYAIYKGFIMDYSDIDLLKFVTLEISKYLEKKGAYEFIIDPNIINIERDTDANIVENGINNYKTFDT